MNRQKSNKGVTCARKSQLSKNCQGDLNLTVIWTIINSGSKTKSTAHSIRKHCMNAYASLRQRFWLHPHLLHYMVAFDS